jgi:hypothetical protein
LGDATQERRTLPRHWWFIFAGLIALFALAVTAQASGSQSVGDTDCNGQINAVDALRILRHSAGLSSATVDECGAIGNRPASLYWFSRSHGGAVFFYAPGLSCHQTGFFNYQVFCTHASGGWGLDCVTSGDRTDCTHTQDGAFTCDRNFCNGSVWTGNCTGTFPDQCERSDGFGVRTATCAWSINDTDTAEVAQCNYGAASFECTHSTSNTVLFWDCGG